MSSSVECRAIAVGSNYPDLVMTTAHLPKELAINFSCHLADWLDVSRSSAISYSDFLSLAKNGPRPHASTGRTRPSVQDVPTWLANQEIFIRQTLKLQLASPTLPFSSNGQLFVPNWSEHEFAMHGLDRWQEDIKKHPGFAGDEAWNELKVDVAAFFSMALDGFFVSALRFEKADHLITEKIQSQELPFSHSPEIGGITLQQLLQSGIRSACLVPLAAGVWVGANSVATGHVASGFQAVTGGSGMTIIALSTLWVADKILKGIKNLKDADFKTQTAEQGKKRRE